VPEAPSEVEHRAAAAGFFGPIQRLVRAPEHRVQVFPGQCDRGADAEPDGDVATVQVDGRRNLRRWSAIVRTESSVDRMANELVAIKPASGPPAAAGATTGAR
jgi:hypothetical protein